MVRRKKQAPAPVRPKRTLHQNKGVDDEEKHKFDALIAPHMAELHASIARDYDIGALEERALSNELLVNLLLQRIFHVHVAATLFSSSDAPLVRRTEEMVENINEALDGMLNMARSVCCESTSTLIDSFLHNAGAVADEPPETDNLLDVGSVFPGAPPTAMGEMDFDDVSMDDDLE